MVPVTHIVLIQLKDEASAEAVECTVGAMMALKDRCLHPKTGKPYIISISGGANNSQEGLAHGLNQGFVLEFASAEDRDYYTSDDPAHKEFKNFISFILAAVIVFDFTNGVFKPA